MNQSLYEGLGQAARCIGRPDFYDALLDVLSSGISWESRAVVRYSLYAPPEYLNEEGLDPELLAVYLRGYYRADPYYRLFRENPRSGVISLTRHLKGRDESPYVMIYASLAGWADELAVMLPGHGGMAIGLFWETEKEPFGESEIDALEQMYPLVSGLHEAHVSRLMDHVGQGLQGDGIEQLHAVIDQGGQVVIASDGWPRSDRALNDDVKALINQGGGDYQCANGGLLHGELLADDFALAPGGWLVIYEAGGPAPEPVSLDQAVNGFREGDLTPREREIVGLIVSGLSNAQIAREMNIEVGSVKNHRGRLYKKLDISSERDLFRMFLDYLVSYDSV